MPTTPSAWGELGGSCMRCTCIHAWSAMYKRLRAQRSCMAESTEQHHPIMYSGPGTAGAGGSAAQLSVQCFWDVSHRRWAFGPSTYR
eukprot:5396141-Alexandrium_andersonii.AAC.1